MDNTIEYQTNYMKRTVLLLICLASVLFSNAQTSDNDEYTGALEVTPSAEGSCGLSLRTATSVGATQSMPGCFGTAEDDIWFKFIATNNRHRIRAWSDQSINPVIELFSLSSGILSSMSCRYITSGSYDQMDAQFQNLIPGNTYYYRVYGTASNNVRTQISTCISIPETPPSNDECSGAIALT